MRQLRFVVLGLAGLYLAAAALMFAFQRQLQYAPTTRAPAPAEAGFEAVSEHQIAAADGTKIVLWYSPAPPGAPTVLYFQGNAGEIADRPKRWASYRDAGLGVAYLSYRGYGGSAGSPTEDGLHQDAAAGYGWLRDQGIPPDRIAVVGESLGTGVAVRLAAENPVAAVILEAPYTTAADVAAGQYPWLPVHILMLDQFRSINHIARINAPLFVVHGEADPFIPISLGRALFEAAAEPKEFHPVPGVDHNGLFNPATFALEIDFIRRTLP